MAAPAPPRQPLAIARNPQQARPAGLLPAPAPNSNKSHPSAQTLVSAKAAAPRLKVLVRRLPPGLSESEFYAALGEEWKSGGPKVDWASYRPGKVSKDAAKASRPSRAYLHLRKEDNLNHVSQVVRDASFNDAKGTASDPALLGPPIVEFAPYGRIPSSKGRKDGRQGTIDQDHEFIDFLESLTTPIPKATPIDAGEKEVKSEDKVVTPLIQYLRDKKSNKGKEAATAAKLAKQARQEPKDAKGGPNERKQIVKAATKGGAAADSKAASAAKLERATKDAVKVVNKQAGAVESKNSQAGATSSPSAAASNAPASSAPKPERRRERGSVSAAAKILQRDLGIGLAGGRRKRDAAAFAGQAPQTQPPASTAPSAVTSKTPSAVAPSTGPANAASPTESSSTPPANSQAVKPPTGPAATRSQPKPPSSARNQPSTGAPAPSSATSTATQAFLKHANPSQGVTEPLLEQALGVHGAITRVEIDKKKGFAYVDFTAPEGLQRAIAASPVPVAQGSVVVLERKTGASLQNRNVKGGGGAGPGPGSGGAGAGGAGAGAGSAGGGGRGALGGAGPGGRGGKGTGGRGRGGRPPGAPGRTAPVKGASATADASTPGSTAKSEASPAAADASSAITSSGKGD